MKLWNNTKSLSLNRDSDFSPNSSFLRRAKRFFFPLFIIFSLASCSSPTETKTASLTGNISLINDSGDSANDPVDFSGITVALYNLAYLDTTIVRINNQYPQIGVHINQHTEFDHRTQEALYSTETNADGSFELKKITPGTYNLVAMKEGWGWRYVYEISLSDGNNELNTINTMYNEECIMNNEDKYNKEMNNEENYKKDNNKEKNNLRQNNSTKSLSLNERSDSPSHYSLSIIHSSLERSDISLFPEIHISGAIDSEVIVTPYHHLIVDDDVIFLPNSYFELQPNSVCRIAGGKSVEIYGSVKMQGEEDGMFTITSNEGYFEDTAIDSLTSSEMIDSIKLQSSDDNVNIEWGKFDWLNNGIMNNSSLNIEHCILVDGNNGIVNNNDNFEFSHNILKNFSTVGIINYNIADIHDSIFKDNYDTARMSESAGNIYNNYFYGNYISVRPFYGHTEIRYNCFEAGEYEISPCASDPIIEYNNFYSSNVSIEFNRYYTQSAFDYCSSETQIFGNNFFNQLTCLSVTGINSIYGVGNGVGLSDDLLINKNYWRLNNPEDFIIDVEDNEGYNYDIIPNPNPNKNNAGIQ